MTLSQLYKNQSAIRLILLFLVIWNIVLTSQLFQKDNQNNLPELLQAQSNQIMIEEYIPTMEGLK